MSDEKTKQAHDNWIEGIDPRLEVMSAAPLVLSTPVQLLAENRITDKNYLFVRNIQDLDLGMTMEPVPLDGWTIELTGLIRPFRVVIRAEDLLAMEQVEYEMILQCSGNGRNEYTGIKGTPWNQGGVGNVRFAGVPLKAILEKHNVEIDPQVKYVTAEGNDGPMGHREAGPRAQYPAGGRRGARHPRPQAQWRASAGHPRGPRAPGHAWFVRHHADQMAHASTVRDGQVAKLLSRHRVSRSVHAPKDRRTVPVHTGE